MQSLVWVHGCFLQAIGWNEIVIGVDDKLGRAPYGLRLAVDVSAAMLVFSTGASNIDGEVECDYTHRMLAEWLETPSARKVFDSYALLAKARLLYQGARLDRISMNTAEEIRAAVALCRTNNCDTLWLVSSPGHMPRCLNEALKIEHVGINIYAAPSETNAGGVIPENTIIVEHPHRGDDDLTLYMGHHVRRMFKVPLPKRKEMLTEFSELLKGYGA